jgi:hypothetical protein
MKEIEHVSELQEGACYYLFSKDDESFRGLEEYKFYCESSLIYKNFNNHEPHPRKGEKVNACYFKNRSWTHEGNNQGMERWHIFGPVFVQDDPTIKDIRAKCSPTKGMYHCHEHKGFGFKSDCIECKKPEEE